MYVIPSLTKNSHSLLAKICSSSIDDHREITLEVRELNSLRGHPILFASSFYTHLDVLSYIGTVYTYYNGWEWERDSAEIDEDRSVYSLYVTKTGVTYERGKA